jgi:hypothetical protein
MNTENTSNIDSSNDNNEITEAVMESIEQNETDTQAQQASGETPAEEPVVKVAKEKGPPAWESFAAALTAHAQALGLDTQVQKGFVKMSNKTTGHKLYLAKQSRKITRCETTLPVLGQPGTHELESPNGRIVCTIDPDPAVVEGFLLMLADNEIAKLPAPKRAAKAVAETPAPVTE